MTRLPITPRLVWLAIGLASAALVTASVILTLWLNLHPCPLCIFQRVLYMTLAALAFVAALKPARLMGGLTGLLAILTALGGVGIAGYQVWLQAQPAAFLGCAGGPLKWVETLVFWLGERLPALFLATGLCGDVEITPFGLSLPTWSLMAFTAFLVAGVWAFWKQRSVGDG